MTELVVAAGGNGIGCNAAFFSSTTSASMIWLSA
jgi:hypothetical protein